MQATCPEMLAFWQAFQKLRTNGTALYVYRLHKLVVFPHIKNRRPPFSILPNNQNVAFNVLFAKFARCRINETITYDTLHICVPFMSSSSLTEQE